LVHVILDGKLFDTDRLTETATSVKGKSIDAWYSGKHRTFGANIQAVMRPDGLPIWTSDAMPGHLHDLTCAQHLDITATLYWAASTGRRPDKPAAEHQSSPPSDGDHRGRPGKQAARKDGYGNPTGHPPRT
jgi:hypothetical protein